MVSTRSRRSGVPAEDNRMVVIVTGANSGFGLGICNQVIRALSLPPGHSIPISTPQSSATPSTLRHLIPSADSPATSKSAAASTKHVPTTPPPTLTLILACRSRTNGENAREILLETHDRELKERARNGMPVREGWREGLRVVIETVDLDSVGGDNGILSFTERIKDRYPHVTSLFLNAGLAAFKGNDYWKVAKQVFTAGPAIAFSHPEFNIEIPGVLTADGERGKVWGVNVLAGYILVKELAPMLQRSPHTLPFPPRVIYTSSATAKYDAVKAELVHDYQLVQHEATYKLSKYLGDLVMCQLDRELGGGERSVRCLTADPGAVATSIFDRGFGPWLWFQRIMKFFYWLAFALTRLIGSPYHPIDATDGATSMVYAALIDEAFLLPSTKVPAPKFVSHSHPIRPSTVDYREVDRWEDAEDIGRNQAKTCESIRLEWRRREGLE
ncbi:hypothetical protein EHS25_005014 [Saitozyma podzolica]|uniref:3-keto-steroid reductase n=1 Tax=Saitozyma podzolica TaxID=1890683 RepID=A0A427Y295_9TREE|nr:hypothetical protein EHS25_005014 [Saitozyma podzolica]